MVFNPSQSDPTWWYVVQVAPQSKLTFEDKNVDMEMSMDPIDPHAIGSGHRETTLWMGGKRMDQENARI